MRRPLVVLAAIAVLLAGGIAAVVIYRLHQPGNIRGSSTEEFTLPTTTAKPQPPPLHISWPQYGFDVTRDRAVQLDLKPPFRRVWRYYAGSLVEFPPAIAYGRLYFSTNSGKLTALSTKTGKRAWIYRSGRCVAASPAPARAVRSEEHTSELQSRLHLVCRLLLEKKNRTFSRRRPARASGGTQK